jgi:preprotein translocase subunit YajC
MAMQVLVQALSLIVAFGILAILAVRPNDSRR